MKSHKAKAAHNKAAAAAAVAAAVAAAGPGADVATVAATAAAIAESLNIGAKICSMKLIQLVRRNEVLYNSDAEGYTDKNHKDIIWERIYKQLFPKFDAFNEELKDRIRNNVRRRWKTLRNAIAREVKKNATIENYSRKKESPIIAELEFLIPHIKSAHCAKLADELGLRESYTFMPDAEEPEEEDYNDLIDLTGEIDIKPLIKLQQHSSEHSLDNSQHDSSSDSLPHAALYPAIQMNTSENSHTDTNSAASNVPNSWSNEYCTVAQYKEGEFTNSNVLCASQESSGEELPPAAAAAAPAVEEPQHTYKEPSNSPMDLKRRRVEQDDSNELHARLMELLSHQEVYDEDRMFLLSLVSDLKRVPPTRKMLVKAEIVTAIARAIQP